ncbi:spore coat putative kinase YutH [Heyndrickxia sp. FSL W8-0496]|uniref:spore coat putative kinase YutH n=1 Tax=Heyndrickxia TaxID=2837504 RepID=UPI00217CFD65|nr:spore coat protein YutH [Heyndrickxia oleronia]
MSIDILKKFFNITPEKSFLEGNYVRYLHENTLYTLIPVTTIQEEQLVEWYEMSEHLFAQGDRYVSRFVSSKDSKFLITVNDEDFCLLKNKYHSLPRKINHGRKLAKFHHRGRSLRTELQNVSRIGQWKSFWEKRLDQMEKVWYQNVQNHPDHEFEYLFIDSFPYYMGLCENAIQYLVDTELDDTPQLIDAGTICHERFNKNTWGKNHWIRNPFDWVYDHATRDLAEWIRDQYFRNKRTFLPDLQQFLRSYQSISPLSLFSWRLLYARLLFPLHYFECIEEYFVTGSEHRKKSLEEKLKQTLRDTEDYERFLGDFFQIAEIPSRGQNLPRVEWLNR